MRLSVPRQPVRGHNLLEVMIAAMIFSTAVILFMGVWQTFYTSQTLARNRLAAAALGQEVLEQKVAAGYSNATPGELLENEFYSDSQIRGRSLRCELSYKMYTDQVDANFRKIAVTVYWNDYAGSKSLTYQTHLYRTN